VDEGSVERRAYPDWLRKREDDALKERRRRLESTNSIDPNAPRVGLALSGGGIRSATFSLGLVQALARSGVLPKVDYLSTVSGGGYIGAFLGALYVRKQRPQAVIEALTEFPESQPLQWLRSNGRFLAPNGAGANWLAGAVLLRNWLSLLFVIAPVAFFISFCGLLARAALRAASDQAPLTWLATRHLGQLAVSPLLVLPALCAMYWMLPCWLAYWMVNAGHLESRSRPVSAAGAATALLVPLGLAYPFHPQGSHLFPLVLAMVTLTASAFLTAVLLRWRLQVKGNPPAKPKPSFDPFGPDRDNIARNKLSEWLKGGFMGVVLTTVVTLLDSLAHAAFEITRQGGLSAATHELMALATAAGTLVLATHRVLAQFGSKSKKKGTGSGVPVQLLTAAAALVLILLGDVVVSTATYWIAVPPDAHEPAPYMTALGIVGSVVAMLLLGRFIVFVNQSSLGPIYNARLTRAYVGASNPNRWSSDATLKGRESPTEPIPGDQLDWDQYKPHAQGGPIHLINVTVNETVDPRVQLHQPDRKGMIMAVGPEGVSLGVRHHAAWNGNEPPPRNTFQVFPTGQELLKAEKLSLGHWVAISGAAVATGLGQLSTWGSSLLCGVFNIRLGYWWLSNVSGEGRHHQAEALSLSGSLMSVLGYLFPVYRLLAAEFLDRFPGTAIESWYLTDGGHLENTGCYELIRRRIPFILCIDNGADPEAECSDLANLVRLARVDFGAEIEFLDREQLKAVLDPAVSDYFGTVQDLKRKHSSPTVYAGLARIRYTDGDSGNGKVSWLVLVKPRVLGTEPLDVTAYGLTNPTFPQQSTGDQSFDDAQWEAYRKLGDHIGTRLFDTKGLRAEGRWSPKWLDEQALDLLNRQPAPGSGTQLRQAAGGMAAAGTAATETIAEMTGRFTVLRERTGTDPDAPGAEKLFHP
jgi:hypothetical protein